VNFAQSMSPLCTVGNYDYCDTEELKTMKIVEAMSEDDQVKRRLDIESLLAANKENVQTLYEKLRGQFDEAKKASEVVKSSLDFELDALRMMQRAKQNDQKKNDDEASKEEL